MAAVDGESQLVLEALQALPNNVEIETEQVQEPEPEQKEEIKLKRKPQHKSSNKKEIKNTKKQKTDSNGIASYQPGISAALTPAKQSFHFVYIGDKQADGKTVIGRLVDWDRSSFRYANPIPRGAYTNIPAEYFDKKADTWVPFQIQTPAMSCYNGVKIWSGDNRTYNVGFYGMGDPTRPKLQEFYDFLTMFDSINEEEVIKNKDKWFKEIGACDDNFMRQLYKNKAIMKKAISKTTQKEYEPELHIKVPMSKVEYKVFDDNNGPDSAAVKDIDEVITERSDLVQVLNFGLWRKGPQEMGTTWSLHQAIKQKTTCKPAPSNRAVAS